MPLTLTALEKNALTFGSQIKW